MDSPIYRIAKWQDTFETAESRRYNRLTWISMPIGFGSNGYQSLVDEFEDDAPAIYGAWCALVSLAAQCTWRGTLCTSKGEPMTIARIARLTYMPRDVFEKLIAWASSESVCWIEFVSQPEIDCLVAGDQPVNTRATERNVTERNVTEPDGTERNGTSPPVVPASPDADAKTKIAIVELANQVIETFKDHGRLSKQNRELAYKAAAFEYSPVLNGYLPTLLERLQAKIRGPDPPKRPWGYFKSEVIRTCRERNIDFDQLWDSIEVPRKETDAKD